MSTNYVFLVEKEEMWAKMLIQVLNDQGISTTALPVYGAGLTLKAGMQEHWKIYVPKDDQAQAEALLEILFSEAQDD